MSSAKKVTAHSFSRVLMGDTTVYLARMNFGQSAFVCCRILITPILDVVRPARIFRTVTDTIDIL